VKDYIKIICNAHRQLPDM